MSKKNVRSVEADNLIANSIQTNHCTNAAQ